MKRVNINSPGDLRELLEHLSEEIDMDNNVSRTLVGNVPRPIVVMFKDLGRKRKQLEQETEDRMHELALKAKQQLKKEFSEREDELEDYHDEVWAKVTAEMGLNPDNNYQVDSKTGKMYLVGESLGNSDSPYTH